MNPLVKGGNLAKMLRAPRANPFPGVIGTFMARDALALGISLLGLNANDTVLLPAYLCREVAKPFLGKTRVEFYEVDADLTVNPSVVRSRLNETRARLIMIINYFGFLQPYRREIKKVCAERCAILMEDCAHSLLTEGSGDAGDLSIYSFRKTLPLPDGGGLRLAGEDRAMTARFYPRLYSNILSVLSVLKSLSQVQSELLSRAGLSSRGQGFSTPMSATNGNGRFLPLSTFAYNGLGNISFGEIIKRRRSDYQVWQEVADDTSLVTPIFGKLPPGVCPLGFPVKTKDRDLVKSRLERGGVFPKIHWRLPATIGSEWVKSHALSMEILTLPVYPELRRAEKEDVARLLTNSA